MNLPKKRPAELWTPTQRKTLLGLCFVLLIFLVIETVRKPLLISDPSPMVSARAGEIHDRLDPNTADTAALSAIPNLGEGRARDIVAYRKSFTHQHPAIRTFTSPDDLMRVKGIGPGISSNLAPYLLFEEK